MSLLIIRTNKGETIVHSQVRSPSRWAGHITWVNREGYTCNFPVTRVRTAYAYTPAIDPQSGLVKLK